MSYQIETTPSPRYYTIRMLNTENTKAMVKRLARDDMRSVAKYTAWLIRQAYTAKFGAPPEPPQEVEHERAG